MERPNELRPYFVMFKTEHGVQFNGTYPLLTAQTVVEDKGVVMVFGTSQQDAEDIATHHLGKAWSEVKPFEDFCLTRSFLRYFPTGIATIPPDWRHKGYDEPMDFLPPKPSCCVCCGKEFESGDQISMHVPKDSWAIGVTVDDGFQTRFGKSPDNHVRAHLECLRRAWKMGLSIISEQN